MHNSFDSSDSSDEDFNNFLNDGTDQIGNIDVETLNNKSLFNKDYVKLRILIDTHNINNKDSFDYSSYSFDLNNNSISSISNNTGGFGNYKNVIGFQFIKSIIPNKSYMIDDTNNKVTYNAKNTSGVANVTITLKSGRYSIEDILEAFPSNSSSGNISFDNASLNLADVAILNTNITYDSITHKYEFTANGTDTNIQFLWGSNTENSAATLLGFLNEDSSSHSSSIKSQKPPDLSTHYVDLIVKEIPYISCKNNPYGYHIIERIPLIGDRGTNILYEPNINENQNYFLPINLNKLSIELRDPINGVFYKTNADHSLEFEVTIIRNNKNIGMLN